MRGVALLAYPSIFWSAFPTLDERHVAELLVLETRRFVHGVHGDLAVGQCDTAEPDLLVVGEQEIRHM